MSVVYKENILALRIGTSLGWTDAQKCLNQMEPGSKQISTKNRNAQRSNHSLLSDECLKGEVKKEIKEILE